MSTPHDAHVIGKRRYYGDRAGELLFYLAGPQRETLEEAEADLERWSGAETRAVTSEDVRKLAEEIARRYGVDLRGLQAPDDTRADWIEARIRALLAELERGWAERAEESHVLQVRAEGQLAALRGALEDAREAIETLPEEALGYNEGGVMHGPNGETEVVRGWPLRDELLDRITKSLAPGAGEREAEVIRAVLENAARQPEGYWIVRLPDEMMAPLLAARGGKGEG